MANPDRGKPNSVISVSGDIEVGDQFVRSGRYLVNPPLEFGGCEVTTLLSLSLLPLYLSRPWKKP